MPYNINTIKRSLGKRRLAKVKSFEAYTVGSFTYDAMCFDIMMDHGWYGDADATTVIFEARPEEYTQEQVIRVLKNDIDQFEYDKERGIKSWFLEMIENDE